MEKKNDGGFAYPSEHVPECHGEYSNGMTLRDYFATEVMQVSYGEMLKVAFTLSRENPKEEGKIALLMKSVSDEIPSSSYKMADAMIKEREK